MNGIPTLPDRRNHLTLVQREYLMSVGHIKRQQRHAFGSLYGECDEMQAYNEAYMARLEAAEEAIVVAEEAARAPAAQAAAEAAREAFLVAQKAWFDAVGDARRGAWLDLVRARQAVEALPLEVARRDVEEAKRWAAATDWAFMQGHLDQNLVMTQSVDGFRSNQLVAAMAHEREVQERAATYARIESREAKQVGV